MRSVKGVKKLETLQKLESYRIEISNLKRSIVDKDNLLEKSKEMLRIAAEREDELLNEVSAPKIHNPLI